ncbi:Lrp/AsnC family transcriptional regulator [Rhizobiaceae sp. 2RAB30]
MAKRLRNENVDLDGVDMRILRILAEDARTSVAEIARAVGMSAPSVSERIRRLQDNGTIAGYTIQVDPAAFGLPLSAWLRIRPVPGELARVSEIIKAIPQVVNCDRVTGEDCFVARVHVRSVADLESVIDRIIPYAMTNTAIVQSSPVAPRLPDIGGDNEP